MSSCKIYYYISAGFGNKIFDIIVALYLKYNYNCEMYAAIKDSRHNKNSDPKIYDIFPKLKKEIKFIPL